jgi:hypothetical protein
VLQPFEAGAGLRAGVSPTDPQPARQHSPAIPNEPKDSSANAPNPNPKQTLDPEQTPDAVGAAIRGCRRPAVPPHKIQNPPAALHRTPSEPNNPILPANSQPATQPILAGTQHPRFHRTNPSPTPPPPPIHPQTSRSRSRWLNRNTAAKRPAPADAIGALR